MSSIQSFFRRLRGGTAPTAAKPLPYSRLTIDDWRSSPERTAYVAELLRTPIFLDLVGMLSNIRPLHQGPLDATTTAVLLGQRTGHDQVIATLLKAANPIAPAPPDIPADYAAENTMAAWDKESDL